MYGNIAGQLCLLMLCELVKSAWKKYFPTKNLQIKKQNIENQKKRKNKEKYRITE